jgi:Rieske Fe-S protein
MERRDFLKTSCSICVALSSGLIFGSLLSSCASFPVYETIINEEKITVPVSLFAKSSIQIIDAKDFKYNIALEKKKDGSYLALLLECTHASTPLNFTGNNFVCPLHGSMFNEQGKVLQGPATLPLKRLAAHTEGNQIIILLS